MRKPKVSPELLKAVIYSVFNEADDDGNDELDMDECRSFIKSLLRVTYPDQQWDEERFKKGFYSIDKDKQGTIDFAEIYLKIKKNAGR